MIIKNDISKLTVNWHFTNACNMSCRFCFADKYSCPKRPLQNMLDVIQKLSIFNRINFVGGEPTIYPHFEEMSRFAVDLGTNISLVTNGSFQWTNPKLLNTCFPLMSKIGISVDSLNYQTNINTGRCVKGTTISQKELIYLCSSIKKEGIPLKINTVVHRENKNESFHEFLNIVEPDQWKIFQVLPVGGSLRYRDLLISDEEFFLFIKCHSEFESIICKEDNTLMQNSYIMVNAEGYFMKTAPYIIQSHQNSLFEKDADALEEFEKMEYDIIKYEQRYQKLKI